MTRAPHMVLPCDLHPPTGAAASASRLPCACHCAAAAPAPSPSPSPAPAVEPPVQAAPASPLEPVAYGAKVPVGECCWLRLRRKDSRGVTTSSSQMQTSTQLCPPPSAQPRNRPQHAAPGPAHAPLWWRLGRCINRHLHRPVQGELAATLQEPFTKLGLVAHTRSDKIGRAHV